ncbi:branched-chain amino acid ABC transporter permease [Lentilitoribacter sp. EG35]|uniref:branched-chain amino acid ABC transporter permease n=1 Tax=Lentilitoribacter sp. EG35 TaxID=3234192 RepID=UPI00345FBC39
MKEFHVNLACILLLVLVPVYGTLFDEPYFITLATKVTILAMTGIGLNLALGYGGLVSLGHAAFFGIGGYVAGILASHALNYETMFSWPFEFEGTTQMLIIWPIAAIVCGLVACIIGYLSLRTSGVYFIMITLAFAQMIYYFAISWPTYGGEDGLSVYLRGSFPGLNTMDGLNFFSICFIWLMMAIYFSHLVTNSKFGLALRATKENTVRVSSVGINPQRIKLIAFIISGVITGLAGALYTDLNRFVSPSVLSWHTSGEIMIFVILGGVARLYGPLVGAALFIILEQILGGLTENWQFWLGVLLLIVVLYARGGIVGLLARRRTDV